MRWQDRYEYLDSYKAKCRLCGVQVDVRQGRGRRHLWEAHTLRDGMAYEPPEPPPAEPASRSEEAARAVGAAALLDAVEHRGSRDWAVKILQNIAEGPQSSPADKTKALDLLKEYEGFDATGRFDDEAERKKHLEQWNRVLARVKELEEIERMVLDGPDAQEIRTHLKRLMEE